MQIDDKIRIAWAEWVIGHKEDPTVVILPEEFYQELKVLANGKVNYIETGNVSVSRFSGMEVLRYHSEKILFA